MNSTGFDQFCKLKSNVFKMVMKLSIMQYHNHLTRDIYFVHLYILACNKRTPKSPFLIKTKTCKQRFKIQIFAAF